MRFGALDFAGSDSKQPIVGAVFPRLMRRGDIPRRLRTTADSVLADAGRNSTSAPSSPIRAAADRFFAMVADLLPAILGTEPTQDLFRDVTYSISNVVLQLAGQEPLPVGEFTTAYARMYPDGQPGLPSSWSTELHESKVDELTIALEGASLTDADPIPPVLHVP
jgi:hypothetical protein